MDWFEQHFQAYQVYQAVQVQEIQLSGRYETLSLPIWLCRLFALGSVRKHKSCYRTAGLSVLVLDCRIWWVPQPFLGSLLCHTLGQLSLACSCLSGCVQSRTQLMNIKITCGQMDEEIATWTNIGKQEDINKTERITGLSPSTCSRVCYVSTFPVLRFQKKMLSSQRIQEMQSSDQPCIHMFFVPTFSHRQVM